MNSKAIIIFSIPNVAIMATASAYFGAMHGDPHAALVAQLTGNAAGMYVLLILLAMWQVWARLWKWLGRPRPRPQRTVAQAKAPSAKANDSAADPTSWEGMPVVAVPAGGRGAREAVIAYARQHGLRPYEGDGGFALGDGQGNYYRVAVG